MIMNPGRARNELVPNGLARIVPWKRNNDRVNEVGMVSRRPVITDNAWAYSYRTSSL
jgi:hypothetical protein